MNKKTLFSLLIASGLFPSIFSEASPQKDFDALYVTTFKTLDENNGAKDPLEKLMPLLERMHGYKIEYGQLALENLVACHPQIMCNTERALITKIIQDDSSYQTIPEALEYVLNTVDSTHSVSPYMGLIVSAFATENKAMRRAIEMVVFPEILKGLQVNHATAIKHTITMLGWVSELPPALGKRITQFHKHHQLLVKRTETNALAFSLMELYLALQEDSHTQLARAIKALLEMSLHSGEFATLLNALDESGTIPNRIHDQVFEFAIDLISEQPAIFTVKSPREQFRIWKSMMAFYSTGEHIPEMNFEPINTLLHNTKFAGDKHALILSIVTTNVSHNLQVKAFDKLLESDFKDWISRSLHIPLLGYFERLPLDEQNRIDAWLKAQQEYNDQDIEYDVMLAKSRLFIGSVVGTVDLTQVREYLENTQDTDFALAIVERLLLAEKQQELCVVILELASEFGDKSSQRAELLEMINQPIAEI